MEAKLQSRTRSGLGVPALTAMQTTVSAEKTGGRATLHEWAVLLRTPNLFTIPGDIIAGCFLAVPFSEGVLSYRILLLIGSSLLLYGGGLILNDWFDAKRDRVRRETRPLAAGRISTRAALAAAVLLLGAALGLAAAAGMGSLAVAAAILFLVVFYNSAARRVPPAGFVTMGLCRGANLLLGASIAFPELPRTVLIAAAIEACYITAVTAAASTETKGPPRPFIRPALPLVLLGGLLFLVVEAAPSAWGAAACVVALSYVSFVVLSMRRDLPAHEMPRKIGSLIRALIPLQAAFVLMTIPPALASAAFIYILWPMSSLVSLKIRGS